MYQVKLIEGRRVRGAITETLGKVLQAIDPSVATNKSADVSIISPC